ncbi:MAG: KPN_02809 family neutral zinc metallopeptidase [Ornithinimicrobium sp.]|uniref:KPN_02809 family neutral zinc metallopeptidase n=1 Tax=Ornithinimicrobium sp. TaxID=1977084 RepID=UPI0018202C5D|nr:neutral zinc metallopeptidase [Actinomycetota bacterium]
MTFRDDASLSTDQVRRGGRGGGIGGRGVAAGGGIGGLLIAVLVYLHGGDPSGLPGGTVSGGQVDYSSPYVSDADAQSGTSQAFPQCRTGADANEDVDCRMVGTVISVQDYWSGAFRDYREAPTVIFDGSVQTGCGGADSSVGPFYCPVDSTIYLDTGFFDQLERLGGDGGPLSQMYVVAHEYGHHIQNLTGVLARSQQDRQGPESGAVRTELQADCFAGAWVAHASQTQDADGETLLEPITPEQIESALSAAEAVGDDRIQRTTQGRVEPEAWTHGSSAQRQHWFMVGYDTGDPRQCDTFNAASLDG